LKEHPQVTILTGNAIERIPAEGTVFYLYHPFSSRRLWEEFKLQLMETFRERHQILLIYNNCCDVDVFRDDPNWAVEDLPVVSFDPAALIRLKARGRS
jgi:hypothetical protein